MKFWKLVSICRGDSRAALLKAFATGRWPKEAEWFDNFKDLCDTQNREALDSEVPDALAEVVVSFLGYRFTLLEGTLRLSSRPGDFDLTAEDVYKRFGGGVIEEVLEYGSLKLRL